MATDLSIQGFEDRPGAYAAVGEALGRAGVNVGGLAGWGGTLHVLVDDAAAARSAIEQEGLQASEREVLVLDVEDRPGAWGEAGRRLADAGVNLEFVYLATSTRLVVAPDDLEKARTAASG